MRDYCVSSDFRLINALSSLVKSDAWTQFDLSGHKFYILIEYLFI
jgi:hypothetical protein